MTVIQGKLRIRGVVSVICSLLFAFPLCFSLGIVDLVHSVSFITIRHVAAASLVEHQGSQATTVLREALVA